MTAHTIKGLRAEFKAQGKFHTPPELALFLRSLVHDAPRNVYDPTCGAGSLLSVFNPDTPKYGQDIDMAALEDAALLDNMHTAYGDVLTNPAWVDKRLHTIVANPPFSIKWTPITDDPRFTVAPTIPTQGKADYAFLLHILHMLADDGIAAVLGFPGILYRGQREGKIRQWMVERNYVDHVIQIPGDTFTDTSISTCCLVLRKDREEDAPVAFTDRELDTSVEISREDIAANGFNLAVSSYVQPPEPKKPPFDPVEVESAAQANLLRKLQGEMRFSMMVARLEQRPEFVQRLFVGVEQVVADARRDWAQQQAGDRA